VRIPLDRQSPIPLYQQIKDYFKEAILSGSLPPETRLPATRWLARDLGANRLAVDRAYNELEMEGLVHSRVGSGTYVQMPFPQPSLPPGDAEATWPLWQQDDGEGIDAVHRLYPTEMLKSSRRANPVNLAGGIGDSCQFPLEEFRRIMQAVLRRDGISALEYGDREGYAPLRSTIAQVLASEGIRAAAESILITSGSQQGLTLTAQLLAKSGDTVLVEEPTYIGAISLFRNLRMKMVGIPVDEQGMQTEKLEKLLQQHHPRLIYTIPNFHNPTGACLPLQRRHQLITLAERYNVPILEDDYVGDLRYEGRAQPALKALDPGGRVIYASTFSKMLMPGLRVGFLAADGPIFGRLARLKYDTDLATSGLIQRAVESFVTIGRYQAHLRRTCQVYRKRRDAMLKAVRLYLPPEVNTSQPQGGLFVWVRLPEGMSSDELLPLACEEGVAFHPGSGFFLHGADGTRYLRLNFAAQPPERIEEGVRRLGRAIERLGGGA